ncbi:MAG: sigma-70 family RNA polymerase sigma factor [Phycisphaerales bacterium]|nr:sigma-70 family RNA polymerase sigma factor [Phycisphaerales bacterium]
MTEPDGASPQARVEDLRLFQAAARSDPEAVRLVWERQRRWVAALLLAYKPREADLEDLLQEVAMTFVRRVGELREAEALKPWLRSVAINAARLAGRKRSIVRRHAEGLRLITEQDPPIQRTPDVVLGQQEDARRLLSLALTLPESYREPLLLRCMQGMSYKEIGRIVGLPETTVETRIARGRRMLRELASAQESVGKPLPRSTPGAGVEEGKVS